MRTNAGSATTDAFQSAEVSVRETTTLGLGRQIRAYGSWFGVLFKGVGDRPEGRHHLEDRAAVDEQSRLAQRGDEMGVQVVPDVRPANSPFGPKVKPVERRLHPYDDLVHWA
ncbi:hypothetical protein [Micromonospora sp. MH33]|uniref:hypothetical protein n=1 Tax=Micromonospora sp. MH33 TaxID=1945509 RepID=UPI001FED4F57|nr:hypothetical protein [Micromonospora sp. MH33]